MLLAVLAWYRSRPFAYHLESLDEQATACFDVAFYPADRPKQIRGFRILLLRWVTGAFLIYQSHDNVLSAERIDEFETFLTQFGFVCPFFMAFLSVYLQFAAGIALILGLLTRWFGLITSFNFGVAVWMVHWSDSVPGIWPAAILIFLGLYFGLRGVGQYTLDASLLRQRLDCFVLGIKSAMADFGKSAPHLE